MPNKELINPKSNNMKFSETSRTSGTRAIGTILANFAETVTENSAPCRQDQSTQAVQIEEKPTPKFTPGQYILRTDNEGHTRMGIIKYAPCLEEMASGKQEYWYTVHLENQETVYAHESRLTAGGLGDWLAAWTVLASLTEGIVRSDRRFNETMKALEECDSAYLAQDWTAFRQAGIKVIHAVETGPATD